MDEEGHEDVSKYLHRRQRDFPLVNTKMTKQDNLTPRMVARALDWAVEVVAEYKKSNQTFHLTSMYLTRFNREKNTWLFFLKLSKQNKIFELYCVLSSNAARSDHCSVTNCDKV